MIRVKSAEDHGLALAAIQIDGGTQSRATLNQHVVDDYAEAIKAGATFPPIVVFYDGKKHWLADGFHRFHAYQKAGKSNVAADVRQGTRRDAILFSVGANETHGLRRTRDDKRRAVETLLNDAEWGKWSDGEIAKRCAVSREYVNRLRPAVTCDQVTSERTYVTKHGTPATMKTAGINASRSNQFQAKASEDNGRITGGAGPVTGEASRLASGRTDAGEAASVDLPTISEAERDADTLQSAWDRACEQGRAMFLARNHLSPKVVRGTRTELSPETIAHMQRCDGGADIKTVHTGINSPSAVAPAEAVAARPASPSSATAPIPNPQEPTSSPVIADKPEPVANGSGALHCPAIPAAADGQPGKPSSDALAAGPVAKADDNAKSDQAVTNLNPRCQKPDTCKWAHSQASCSACNNAWMKARAA